MTKKINAFCCWSGGKESALSFYRANKSGVNISYLVNMVSGNGKYSRTHGISTHYLKLQSEAMGIPIIQKKTSWQNYENNFKQVILDLKDKGLNLGIFGDIDLQEHRDWVEMVCRDAGIKPILPLWKEKREVLLKEFMRAGFKSVVVATQVRFLDSKWLGRHIDKEFIQDLKALKTIDLCGEKGEYHTFVYDGPIFQNRIEFEQGSKTLRDKHWFLEIV